MLLKQKMLLVLQAASSVPELRGAGGVGSVPLPDHQPLRRPAPGWMLVELLHSWPSACRASLDVRVDVETGHFNLFITVILSMRAVELGMVKYNSSTGEVAGGAGAGL